MCKLQNVIMTVKQVDEGSRWHVFLSGRQRGITILESKIQPLAYCNDLFWVETQQKMIVSCTAICRIVARPEVEA